MIVLIDDDYVNETPFVQTKFKHSQNPNA